MTPSCLRLRNALPRGLRILGLFWAGEVNVCPRGRAEGLF